jgi:hypothetical protein
MTRERKRVDMGAFNMRMVRGFCLAAAFMALAVAAASAEENYESWTVLRSTFPSTGGNGIMIKGYDPVLAGDKCVTTFMAVTPDGKVYPNYIEFEAVPAAGGTLCQNGKWRAFDGGATGTTPFRVFFKDGVIRGFPLDK